METQDFMRFDYRLALIACVSACAPMLPAAQPVAPSAPVPASQPPRGAGSAPTPPPTPAQTSGVDQPGFEGWKQGFLDRKGGARRAQYEQQLANLTPDPEVIRLDSNQPEFSRPAGAYISNAASAARIAEARRRIDAVPWGVTRRYGVPAEILVAIWGNESSFGQVQGNSDVIRSLATLAFEGRRRDWAEGQLKDALDIVIDGRRERAGLLGSWAGAMGQTQFLPGVYLSTAIDGDGDGHRDIWGSTHDALASTANYMAKAGWKPGESWSREVLLPAGFDYALTEGTREPLANWTARNVRRADGLPWSTADQASSASLILPSGYQGPAFLIFPNHAAIMKYNNSTAYALGVGLLALRFGGEGPLVTPWPFETPLSRADRILAQESLVKLGYDTGGVDGAIGPKTRVAIRAWQQANRIPADGYLTPPMIQSIAMQAAGMASRP